MRKLLALSLTVLLLLGLCSCENGTTTDRKDTMVVDQEQRRIYYEAAEKTNLLDKLEYDISAICTVTYPNQQSEISKQAHIEKNGSVYHAELSSNDTVFDCFYMDGYIYSDESGGCFKAPVTEKAFGNYIDSSVYSAVGAEFANVILSEKSDGGYTVELAGMTTVPEAFEDMLDKLGMTDCVLGSISGQAAVDSNGIITCQSITAELNMTDSGQAVTGVYSAEIKYITRAESEIQLPTEVNYIEIDDIDTPMLVKNSYKNITGCSYDASYESLYSYHSDDAEYSMKLNYAIEVTEPAIGFEASDETAIVYNTVNGTKTVNKSSEYRAGKYSTVNGNVSNSEEMSDSSARSLYNHMLLDYEPEFDVFRSLSVCDTGSCYEIKYEYSDYGVLLYCQNVLTALINDQEGAAVHAENFTIVSSQGTIVVDKKLETLLSHEISISTQFNNDAQSFYVGFDHVLNVEIH